MAKRPNALRVLSIYSSLHIFNLCICRSIHVFIIIHTHTLSYIHSFIHSEEIYVVPLQENTSQRRSQASHDQRRRTSERCKILNGGPSARYAAQREDHFILKDPQPKGPFA